MFKNKVLNERFKFYLEGALRVSLTNQRSTSGVPSFIHPSVILENIQWVEQIISVHEYLSIDGLIA